MSRDEICLSYWLCLTLPVILDHLHDAQFEPEVEETQESVRYPLHSRYFGLCMHGLSIAAVSCVQVCFAIC